MKKIIRIQYSNDFKRLFSIPFSLVFISLTMLGLMVLSLSGCSFPDSEIASKDGYLMVSIGTDKSSDRSLLPNINMLSVEYIINGTGPEGAVFETVTTGEDSYLYGLAIGEWLISVMAINSEGVEIGYGESMVLIEGSSLISVTINIDPLTGAGSLALLVTWPDEEVTTPGLTAVLTDFSGETQSLLSNMGAGTAESINTEIPSGYYTLRLQLYDGEDVIAGLVDTVRIVQDAETIGTYSFTGLNLPTGDVEINVIVDLDTPLEVAVTGAVDILSYGTNMTVEMLIANPGENIINYQWYLNGSFSGTGDTLSLGMDLRPGTYRLDGVAITADGERSGSAFHSFTVE